MKKVCDGMNSKITRATRQSKGMLFFDSSYSYFQCQIKKRDFSILKQNFLCKKFVEGNEKFV